MATGRTNHTCNYYCADDTHAGTFASTGAWTAEEILDHINSHDAFSLIALRVAPAPEAPVPHDAPGAQFIDKHGHISPTRSGAYTQSWLLLFRWKPSQIPLFPTTEED